MSRPALVVHGHFYQPPRLDPFTGITPQDPTAAPAHDWNERISADCYRPNAELGNLGAISWNLGPTLAGWMQNGDPVAYRGFVDGDAGRNGMAQPFHHPILPLASSTDRRTEVRWGLRDFEVRFGRRPTGMWLPETAVDIATLRLLADEGIAHTILAPSQVEDGGLLDPRLPVRIDLGDGRSIVAIRYDAPLSTAVSFEPSATVDADRFVAERIGPTLVDRAQVTGAPLIVIATDGELYGHHQPHREHFLARLVGRTKPPDPPYDTPTLEVALARASAGGIALGRVRERTSWSCPHGIDRWMTACGCVPDGAWKAPLRAVLDRLAGGVDSVTDHLVRALPGSPDPWQLRDAWIDVILGVRSGAALATEHLGAATSATPEHLDVIARVMEAQRWRLAMFASCAWFWDRPDRVETAGALRAATRAARLVDALAGTDLERRLIGDLALIEADGIDGVALLDAALRAVGAPVSGAMGLENPSARGLRATG